MIFAGGILSDFQKSVTPVYCSTGFMDVIKQSSELSEKVLFKKRNNFFPLLNLSLTTLEFCFSVFLVFFILKWNSSALPHFWCYFVWLIWLLVLITSVPNPICISEMAQSYFLLCCLGSHCLIVWARGFCLNFIVLRQQVSQGLQVFIAIVVWGIWSGKALCWHVIEIEVS